MSSFCRIWGSDFAALCLPHVLHRSGHCFSVGLDSAWLWWSLSSPAPHTFWPPLPIFFLSMNGACVHFPAGSCSHPPGPVSQARRLEVICFPLAPSPSVPASLPSPTSCFFFSLCCTAVIPVVISLLSSYSRLLTVFLPPVQPLPTHLPYHNHSVLYKTTHLYGLII